MKTSSLLDFLRARLVLVVCFGALVLVLGLAQSCTTGRRPPTDILAVFEPATSNLHLTVTRKTAEMRPLSPSAMPSPVSLQAFPAHSPMPAGITVSTSVPNLMISIRVPPDSNAPAGPFLPTGRLLPCQLVTAIDSATPDTVILGVVVQDVWWAGEVVIPKGTEVHGRAQLNRVRDRIMSQGKWVLVWPTGEELTLSGIAMTRDYDAAKHTWGPQDCTPGLLGQIITSTSLDEIKLFLATALSGFAQGMQQQRTTVLGIEHIPATARNAALAGTSQVLNTYAQQVLEAIKRDGLYVHVSPRQFYVYLDEPVDRLKARIAGSRILPSVKSEPAWPTAAQSDSTAQPAAPVAPTPARPIVARPNLN